MSKAPDSELICEGARMKDQYKTKKQLLEELGVLQNQLVELKKAETDRQRVEEALKASEQRFRNIFEGAVDGILLADMESKKFRVGNQMICNMLGYSPEEVRNLGVMDIHPDEALPFVMEQFDRLARGEITKSSELPVKRKDSSVFYAEISTVLLKLDAGTYLMGNFRDITDRKQAEEALRESEERYRRLVDNSLMGIGISCGDQVIFANPALLRLFGYADLAEFTKIPLLNHVAPASHELVAARMEKVAQGEPVPVEFEYDILRKDGLTKTLLASSQHYTLSGKTYSQTTFQDITERKRAEEELRESEERFRLAFENANTGVCLVDLEGNLTRVNNKMCEIFGYTKEELERMTVNNIAHPEDIDVSPAFIQKTLRGETDRGMFEKRYIHKKGHVVTCQVSSSLVRDAEGSPLYFISHVHDITDRKQAEEALHQADEMLRAMLEAAPVAIFALDTEGLVQNIWNPAAERLLGWSRQEVLGRFLPSVPEEGREEFRKFREWMRSGKSMVGVDVRRQRKDGSPIDYSIYAAPLYDVHAQVTGNIAVLVDITERKRAEEALRESEERFRKFADEASFEGVVIHDKGKVLDVNRQFATMHGYEVSELLEIDTFTSIAPESRDIVLKHIQEGYEKPYEAVALRKDGSKFPMEIHAKKIPFHGKMVRAATIRDMTERKKADEALRVSEKRFKELFDEAPVGYFEYDAQGRIASVNRTELEMLGYTAEEMIGHPLWEFVVGEETVHQQILGKIAGTIPPARGLERTYKRKDGTILPVLIEDRLLRDENGKITGIRSTIQDITERKRAEEEKAALQEQLRQSQKIEAIGRLAGGIAHDFNNLLTVIKGYSQLSLVETKDGSPLKENLEEIKKAAEKAADLTRQLLAFSRRQILEMKVLDLNNLLMDLDKMLHRLIGEDIELITLLADGLGRVKTDPGWVEQMIMNLGVNARDAMPNGGKLTIETANVELDDAYARGHIAVKPGRYVMLSVSDTGVGMTPEVRQQVFEPFFTTKEKGRGTGLGLSTVYGMVKQSGGNIWVYSEPGQGTAFKIYLPRVDEPLEELKERVVKEELPQGKETVLVVEDEEAVRQLAVRILKGQGYTVLDTPDGEGALVICEKQKESLHLILTDVVMPGMSGRQLVERCWQIRQDFKVLYMSGYTDNAIVRHGVLEEGVNYIQKPFTVEGLARKVREILDK
jgi:two-component system cell cycle sensor histidine kinase/response regulator CckA